MRKLRNFCLFTRARGLSQLTQGLPRKGNHPAPHVTIRFDRSNPNGTSLIIRNTNRINNLLPNRNVRRRRRFVKLSDNFSINRFHRRFKISLRTTHHIRGRNICTFNLNPFCPLTDGICKINVNTRFGRKRIGLFTRNGRLVSHHQAVSINNRRRNTTIFFARIRNRLNHNNNFPYALRTHRRRRNKFLFATNRKRINITRRPRRFIISSLSRLLIKTGPLRRLDARNLFFSLNSGIFSRLRIGIDLRRHPPRLTRNFISINLTGFILTTRTFPNQFGTFERDFGRKQMLKVASATRRAS